MIKVSVAASPVKHVIIEDVALVDWSALYVLGASSVGRVPDSKSKSCDQFTAEAAGDLCVCVSRVNFLTNFAEPYSVSIPPLCYCSGMEKTPVILPEVQVAGYT